MGSFAARLRCRFLGHMWSLVSFDRPARTLVLVCQRVESHRRVVHLLPESGDPPVGLNH